MSVFRPTVRVTAPDGTEWEIYAYRLELPVKRLRDPVDTWGCADYRSARVAGLIDAVTYPFGGIGRLVALLLWHVPKAWIRMQGSDAWTVEAVSWNVNRTSLSWRTTTEYRGHVLAQVEGQLARGETPKVQHAEFLGESDSGY